MRTLLVLLLTLPFSVLAAETRCGWLENPSPANLWLIDADSIWTISEQGGVTVSDSSMDNLPTTNDDEYVRTNVNYGFSCVCLRVDTDRSSSRILVVHSGEQLLLKQCLEDPKIRSEIPLR